MTLLLLVIGSFLLKYTSATSDNDTNTVAESATYYDYGITVKILFCVAYTVIFVLALGGNISVVYVIMKHRSMRTRTNLLLCNLAVADIIVTITDIPVAMATIIIGDFAFNFSPYKELFCSLNGFTVGLGIMLSIQTLMWISVHKFISITGVIGTTVTRSQICMMIACAWCWSTFYNLLGTPLVGFSETVYKTGASQCGPIVPKDTGSYIHSILNKTFNFVIPMIVMSFCYWKIFSVVREHLSSMDQFSDDGRRNTMIEQKRILKTLFVVMACFFCCFLPYIFYSLSLVFKLFDNPPPILNPLAYLAIYLNSACNPIIYALRAPSFRKGFRGCFNCFTKDQYQGRFALGSLYESRTKSRSNFSSRKKSSLSNYSFINKSKSKKDFAKDIAKVESLPNIKKHKSSQDSAFHPPLRRGSSCGSFPLTEDKRKASQTENKIMLKPSDTEYVSYGNEALGFDSNQANSNLDKTSEKFDVKSRLNINSFADIKLQKYKSCPDLNKVTFTNFNLSQIQDYFAKDCIENTCQKTPTKFKCKKLLQSASIDYIEINNKHRINSWPRQKPEKYKLSKRKGDDMNISVTLPLIVNNIAKSVHDTLIKKTKDISLV